MKRILVLNLLLLSALVAQAQSIKLSDNADQFLPDLQKLMATGGPGAVQAVNEFDALWSENRLTPAQKTRVIALTRQMNTRRLGPVSHFAPLLNGLYHSVYTQKPDVPEADINNYLTVMERTFQTGDMKAYATVLATARLFLSGRLLYANTNGYNRTYALGGTFAFSYRDAQATDPQSNTTATPATDASRFDGWDEPMKMDSGQARPLGRQFVPQRRALPAVTGPVLTVKNGFLSIVAANDSVVLANTDMDVLLKDGMVVGKGGKFTWETADRPDIFVTLGTYAMKTMGQTLAADDATLTFDKSPKPITGVFEYVAKKRYSNQTPTYPRFMSWQSDVLLPGLGEGVTYRGGLALSGPTLVGSSASGQVGVLTVSYQGKPGFRASSRRFAFTDSLITAELAGFVGYLDPADSVAHPGVQFRYDPQQRVAWLNRPDRSAYATVPYTDTYHKFFIQPEVTRWDLPRRKVDFYQVGAKREVPVRFESYDYFRPERYANISVDYGFHPLQIAGNYVSTTKTQTFLADDLAQFAKLNPGTLASVLDRMVREGYLDREEPSGLMRLSRKGVLYVLAYAGKRDYDNFQVQSLFASSDSVKNATINLTNKLLTIRGVSRFVISDSLKIVGTPSDKTLRLGKGRSFTLNGQLKSGNFRYSGRDLAFDYDKFSMNMSKIDSITFVPQKLAAQGRSDEVGGDIKYDKPGAVFFAGPDNKSGRMTGKKTTQRLVMPEGMTVYFNQPVRGNITYNQRVYFKIPAIDNDSLGKGDISFIGTFTSDGIFPPFKAELKTMPDNTLGFVHKAPATGYAVYGSKSNVKFTGDLVMDQTGLRSEGTLNHLTASVQTTGLLFMTDSLLASGSTGEIREGLVGKAYFPRVELRDYSLKWWPKADSMVVATKTNNINFYNGSTKLEGDLVLRLAGVYGKGTLRRADSEAVSDNIKFNKEGFFADNARFSVVDPTAKTAGRPMLLGNAVDVDFNQVKSVVNISMNAKKASAIDDTLSSSLDFPNAAYRTNISRAQWNITAKTIAMRGDVKTSTFTATGEDQENLTFNGGAALYDVEKATLNISGVPFVKAADALIFPDKGLVAIKRNGEMLAFKNARLELDTIDRQHKLKNGNIQILSRTRFSGDATYQFITAADTADIKMGSFELKEAPKTATLTASTALAKTTKAANRRRNQTANGTTYFTVARAEIEEDDKLLLAPRIQFKGSVTMLAPEKDLQLAGYVKPVLKKRADLVGGWVPFKEQVQEDIRITLNKDLKNEAGQLLVAGLHFRGGSGGIYPTFLSAKEDSRDDDLFTTTGEMRYDGPAKLFRIERKGADGLTDEENGFTFNDPRGIMTYSGKLGLLGKATGDFMQTTGSVRASIDSANYRLNTLMLFSFPIAEPLNAAIADRLIKSNLEEKNDEPADDDLSRLSDKLEAIIGRKATDDYRNRAQNQHVSLTLASPLLNNALLLTDANLRWADKQNAFYSTGMLGVGNLGPADVNTMMPGMMEIRKTPNGDELSLYIESSPDVWVFYDYRQTGSGANLAIVTSEQDLNDRITAGATNRTAGPPKLKSTIQIVSATPDEKDQFTERYELLYKPRKAAPKPKPKPAPKPTAKPAPATAPVATANTDDEDPDPEPVAPKPAPAKKVAGQKTPAGKTAPAEKTAPAVTKAKPTPMEREKKKDKEDEKEGF
jgi:hypothetical protein